MGLRIRNIHTILETMDLQTKLERLLWALHFSLLKRIEKNGTQTHHWRWEAFLQLTEKSKSHP
jgi:hypothetical protein